MARALNATGRPIVYSCSWPAYQGGLPPKVRVVPFLGGCFPCSLCPGGAPVGAAGARCYTPLTPLPLVGGGCRSRERTWPPCQASGDTWGS